MKHRELTKPIKRLLYKVVYWGGTIINVDESYFMSHMDEETFSEAPFTNNSIGVFWKKKHIVTVGVPHPGHLLHEMGHIFACKYEPNAVECDEFTFVGWEYKLAEEVGVVQEWLEFMQPFGVDPHYEFGMLPIDEQKVFLERRMARSHEYGLFDQHGRARPIR